MKALPILLILVISYHSYSQNLSDRFRAKAEDYFDQGNTDNAFLYYKKAFAIAKQNNDYVRMTSLCVDISSVYHYNTDYDSALAVCKEGLIYRARIAPPVDSVSFKLYASLGTMLRRRNILDSARHYFELANNLLIKNKTIEAKIPTYVIHFYNNYGGFLNSFRDYSNGVLFIEKALLIAQKYGLKEDERIILTHLSNIYEILGENEKALSYSQRANEEQTEENQFKCFTLSGLGWCLILNKKYEEGITTLKNALKLTKKLKAAHKMDDNFEINTTILYNLGIAYRMLKEDGESEKYFQDVITIFKARKINKHIRMAKAFLRLSELQKDNFKLSLDYTQQALKSLFTDFESKNILDNPREQGILNQTVSIEILTQKSALLFDFYKHNNNKTHLDLASKTIQLCLDIVSNTRNNYDYSASKLLFNSAIHSSYELAVKIAYAKYQLSGSASDKEYIFTLIENSKATELSEALYISSIKLNHIPAHFLKKEDSLNRLILEKQLLKNKEDELQLNSLKIEKINLLRLIEKKFPDYYKLKFETTEVRFSDIQKKLTENTVFLSYFSTGQEYFICVVTNKTFEIKTIPVTAELVRNLYLYRKLLYQNPGFGNYEGVELSSYLYHSLVTPVKSFIQGKNKLIISRDWLINFLPFEVLESGQIVKDYMIKNYSIGYTYSARQIIENSPETTSVNTLGIAPFNDSRFKKGPLKYLPESEKQVVEIADEVLLGKDASKNNFMKYYQDFGILYLATHSVMNDKLPNKSSINFYPENDFQLTVEEVYNLKLTSTRLVVLSSCDAGTGQEHHSEGMLSIARAFSFAGCSSIISTLWATNDESASILTQRLHHYLKKGYPKDIALQKAKIDFIDKDFAKKYNHPYFWSNLILIGDDEPVFQNSFSKVPVIIGVLLLLVLGFTYFFYKEKRNVTF